MDQSLLELMHICPIFSDFNREQLEYLIGCNVMKIAAYKRNDIVFWKNTTPLKLYLLISGGIAMARDTQRGKRSLSKTNNVPGDLIGTVRLFSPSKLLWDYAVALEDSRVIEIDSSLFVQKGIIDMDIQLLLLRNIIGNVVEKIDYLGQKVRILSTASARKRIAYYLLSIQDEKGHIMLSSTREEIADYLDIARPSLSRELGRMQKDGIIRIDGHKVQITDQDAFDTLFD